MQPLEKERKILEDIPLTSPTGKIRIKTRSQFNEYGIPHATKRNPLNSKNYVEWQISYYIDKSRLAGEPSLPEMLFSLTSNEDSQEDKAFYELTEYLYYFYYWGVISKNSIEDIHNFLISIEDKDLISNHSESQIKRTHPMEKDINGIKFHRVILEYPQLVYKFDKFEIIAEITIKEKQRAVGVQPMLFLCFPITELEDSDKLIGRTAETNEKAIFVFHQDNHHIILEMLKIFGMLSENHRKDITTMLQKILSISL